MDFSFQEFDKPKTEEKKDDRKKINFNEISQEAKELLEKKNQQDMIEKYSKEEPIHIPADPQANTSYLSLILTPNLKELELMIRGLEYVKRFNQLTQKDEIILRKIPDHPLNDYGVNRILSELRIYTSPEIKLGRKSTRDYYNSVQHVCHSIVRLIYKNLKNFGMDTQVKQRNAKEFCNAIIEFVDASYSRSLEGKENDISRATELKIEGTINPEDYLKGFPKEKKEQLKN